MNEKATAPWTWDEGSALVAAKGRSEYAAQRIREALEAKGWGRKDLLDAIALATKPKREGEPQRPGYVDASLLSRLLAEHRLTRTGRPVESRYLSIDQLLVMAAALEIPVGELLLPAGSRDQYEKWRLLDQAADLRNEVRNAAFKLESLMRRLQRMADDSPEFRQYVQSSRDEVRRRLDEQDRAEWEQQQVVTEADIQFGYEPPRTMGISPKTPWEIVCDGVLGERTSDAVTLWGDEDSDG